MSQLTITLRRSNLSMITPPTVPRKKPGTTRVTITRLTAAPELFDTRAAIARIAMRPIQSPRLETNCASHSRKNDLLPNSRHGAGGIGGSSASRGMNGALDAAGSSSGIAGSPCGSPAASELRVWPSLPPSLRSFAVFFAAVFLAVVLAAGFLAFLTVDFFAVRFAAFFTERFVAGARAARSRKSSIPCSSVIDSGSVPRGTDAFVVPSVT